MEEILRSLPEPLQPNGSILIITAIFLILIVILNQFVFKPLVAIMEEREKRIKEGARAREQSLKTVEEKMAAYRAALVDARRQAQAKRQTLLKESEMVRNESNASSKEQAMAMVQAAATELDQQVEEAKASLKQETQTIAQRIVSAVLSRASA